MNFSSINVFTDQFYNINGGKYSTEKLKEPLKTLFEEAITTYGFGADNFERNFVTIFIFNEPQNETSTLPQSPIKNIAEPQNDIYKLDNYTNRVTQNADIFNENAYLNHTTLDLAISIPNTPAYKCFSIPQTVQNVFKSILFKGGFIGTNYHYEKHIQIVLHNENIFDDGNYDTLPPLLEKIWISGFLLEMQDLTHQFAMMEID